MHQGCTPTPTTNSDPVECIQPTTNKPTRIQVSHTKNITTISNIDRKFVYLADSFIYFTYLVGKALVFTAF